MPIIPETKLAELRLFLARKRHDRSAEYRAEARLWMAKHHPHRVFLYKHPALAAIRTAFYLWTAWWLLLKAIEALA